MYLPMARTQESWGKHFKMDDDGLPMIPELGLGHGHIIYRRNALYIYTYIHNSIYITFTNMYHLLQKIRKRITQHVFLHVPSGNLT